MFLTVPPSESSMRNRNCNAKRLKALMRSLQPFPCSFAQFNSGRLHLAMVVAMIAVRMMQVAIHQVIGVIAVRNALVAAAGAMAMRGVVFAAIVVGRATVRIAPPTSNRCSWTPVALTWWRWPSCR